MKQQTKLLLAATTIAALGIGYHSDAAIVYVDAAEGATGNTFATGGSLADTTWQDGSSGGSTLDKWSRRTVFGNGGEIFEADARSTSDTIPELTTQVSVSNGLYDAWVFFWDASGSAGWSIAAGLTSGSLTTYSFDGDGITTNPPVSAASTLDFDVDPIFTESDRTMYGVYLGQTTVSDGTLEIFIDGIGNSQTSGLRRTWYDGVGYEVVPEPSSLALLCLGGLLIARRRRG